MSDSDTIERWRESSRDYLMNSSCNTLNRTAVAAFAVVLLIGCGGEETTRYKQAPETPSKTHPTGQSEQTLTAATVLGHAIDALGGENALAKLKTGHAVFRFTGFDIPELQQEFGEGDIIVEVHFDYPERERRVARNKDGTRETLMISANGTLWVRNPKGKVSTVKAPAPHVYNGPFLVGTLSNLLTIRDSGDLLQLDTSELQSHGYYIIDIHHPEETDGRIFIDATSWHLLKNEKTTYKMDPTNFLIPTATTTLYGKYETFTGIPIRTSFIIIQEGREITTCRLEEVTFVEKIDESHFKIPM